MDTRASRFPVAVATGVAALTVMVCWLVSQLVSDWASAAPFDTAESAVIASCHANDILANYTPARATNIRIGWQETGNAPGFGWTALVVREDGGYRVKDCKYQHVVHA